MRFVRVEREQSHLSEMSHSNHLQKVYLRGLFWGLLQEEERRGGVWIGSNLLVSRCAPLLQQMQFTCPGQSLNTIIRTQLAVDSAGMGFDRSHRDRQFSGDGRVG